MQLCKETNNGIGRSATPVICEVLFTVNGEKKDATSTEKLFVCQDPFGKAVKHLG